MTNTINEMKITLKGNYGRLDDIEEWIRKLKDRVLAITEDEQLNNSIK